jgi:hypothetical protein
MQSRIFLLLPASTASLICLGAVAEAGSALARPAGVSCADFRRKPDGSWTPVRRTVVVGPRGPFSVEPGEVFYIQLQGTTN